LPPLGPIERRSLNYSDLEHWMTHADQVLRTTRRALDQLTQGPRTSPEGSAPAGPQGQPEILTVFSERSNVFSAYNAAMTASPSEAAVASSCELVSSAGAIDTLSRTAP
jgi:hypothetical protein